MLFITKYVLFDTLMHIFHYKLHILYIVRMEIHDLFNYYLNTIEYYGR